MASLSSLPRVYPPLRFSLVLFSDSRHLSSSSPSSQRELIRSPDALLRFGSNEPSTASARAGIIIYSTLKIHPPRTYRPTSLTNFTSICTFPPQTFKKGTLEQREGAIMRRCSLLTNSLVKKRRWKSSF